MIKIRIMGSFDRIEGFMIWGHSRFAPYGSDVVCSGVSALVIAALIGLEARCPGDARFRVLPEGFIYCRLSSRIAASEEGDAQAILTAMTLGLEAICEDYKNYIDISYRR